MTKKNEDIEFIPFDEAMNSVLKETDRTLLTTPSIVRKYTGYLAGSRGKNIRALALLASAENKDGRVHSDAVKLASSIEILHLATLVHDDVMDDADIRRGKDTLQKKYGKRDAVICGDYLLSLAVKLAGESTDREKYIKLDVPDYMGRLCLGELSQDINNWNLNLSAMQYLRIISGKTAALFEASFYIGAVIGDTEGKALSRYMRLGKYTGMIFQLTDDCMDFEATERVARKPVKSDFEQGVVTLPLIYALGKMRGLKDRINAGGIANDDIDGIVQRSGGLIYTHRIAAMYFDKAKKIIDNLDVTDDKRRHLNTVLNKVYRLE